jgi:hypothetical protein
MNRGELRTAILRRADMVGSSFVSDAELDVWIDLLVTELHGILRQKYGDEYWSGITWIQVRPGSDASIAWPRLEINPESAIPGPDTGYASAYALPLDFLSLVRCQFLRGTVSREVVQIGTGEDYQWRSAENWTLNCPDMRAYPMRTIDTPGELIDFTPRDWTSIGVRYRLRSGPVRQLSLTSFNEGGSPAYSEVWHHGTIIEFLPPPIAEYAVQVTYVRAPQLLPNHPHIGYVICGVAAMCLQKQQQDPSALLAEQGKVVSLITGPSATVDAANPRRVTDVRRTILGLSPRGYWDLP